MSNEINMIAELLKQHPELTSKLKEVIAEIDEENKTADVEDFIRLKPKQSYYVIHFDLDQRDADCISVSTSEIYGKMDIEELTKLTILANYMLLDDYDGEWYNLGPLEEFISDILMVSSMNRVIALRLMVLPLLAMMQTRISSLKSNCRIFLNWESTTLMKLIISILMLKMNMKVKMTKI